MNKKLVGGLLFDGLYFLFAWLTMFTDASPMEHNAFFGFIFITNLVGILYLMVYMLDKDALIEIMATSRIKPNQAFLKTNTYQMYSHISDAVLGLLLFAGGWFFTAGIFIIFKMMAVGIDDDVAEKMQELQEEELNA